MPHWAEERHRRESNYVALEAGLDEGESIRRSEHSRSGCGADAGCWRCRGGPGRGSRRSRRSRGPGGTAGPVDPPAVDLLAPPPDPLALPPALDPLAPPPPDPLAPPPPDPLAVPVAAGPVAGQDPTPFVGPSPFRPPTFNPVDGAMVGVAKPIVINFAVPIADRAMAESAIHISSIPPVPGKFYWMSPTQVRWRPFEFWPANTAVNIDAAGTKSSFRTGDSLVATADDATHQMTITRNGVVQKTFPMSMGMVSGGHQTPNGTYYVLEKFATVVMDSSTYGVPVNSAQGYKLTVSDAVRIDNSGNFVHSAPWSVADQGKRNVTHGCINLSPANAKWFYDNFGSGDPVVVKNSVGTYNKNDGAQDWQI
ncbi:L,D-transpeptidase LdtMt4 [Mycobacterium tuberculosis]|uniref:L,D-transpeptidase LdtMt4 n=1 Tax=Mycobacterium tuberculosis TaxID=1773 RepID=UPI00096A365E|nr:L,D-transpeptidase LdtMt4 [Mycobacterium tuberculosis]